MKFAHSGRRAHRFPIRVRPIPGLIRTNPKHCSPWGSRALGVKKPPPVNPPSRIVNHWKHSQGRQPSLFPNTRPTGTLPVHYRYRTCISTNVHTPPYRSRPVQTLQPPKGGGPASRVGFLFALANPTAHGRLKRLLRSDARLAQW